METEIIKIGSRKYKVIYSDEVHHEGNLGVTLKDLGIIKIDTSYPNDTQEITLLHEILHACCDFVGMTDIKYTEEEFVNRISGTLCMVLKENDLWRTKLK